MNLVGFYMKGYLAFNNSFFEGNFIYAIIKKLQENEISIPEKSPSFRYLSKEFGTTDSMVSGLIVNQIIIALTH